VGDSEGFETWVDEERLRTRALARNAGLALANACEQTGDVARALDVYERFRARLAEEFEAEPAAETVRLADGIRASRSPVRDASLRTDRLAPSPTEAPSQTPDATAERSVATTTHLDPVPPMVTAPPTAHASHRRARRVALSAGLLVVGTAVAFGLTRHGDATPKRRELIVLPMENATGRSDLEYLATGLDDEVASRLRGIGGLGTTKSAARSTWAATRTSLWRTTLRAELAFRGKLTLVSDSFVVTGNVVDVASGQSSDVGRFAFLVDGASDVASRVAAGVAGAIFREPLPDMPRDTRKHISDGESFRLTLKGWHELLTEQDEARAKETFLEAIALDLSNARARAGLRVDGAVAEHGAVR
jgi:TolB-like protein